MPRDELLASLITRLIAATSFEDAATATLQAMLGSAGAALADSPYAARGRLLRAVVHLRPGDSYQRLFGIEHPGGHRVEELGYLTSANVWRWLTEHSCSVSIDLQLGLLRAWTRDGPIRKGGALDAAGSATALDAPGLPGQVTREHMLGRNTTHVHVVPLRAPGGAASGMITLEACCQAAIGREFVWEQCHEELATMAGAGAPYLGGLRPRAPEAAPKDALLPVVGASTAALVELLRVFADQEETILIGGPTGSGKSRLAHWCHEHSRRKDHSFETLDLLRCSSPRSCSSRTARRARSCVVRPGTTCCAGTREPHCGASALRAANSLLYTKDRKVKVASPQNPTPSSWSSQAGTRRVVTRWTLTGDTIPNAPLDVVPISTKRVEASSHTGQRGTPSALVGQRRPSTGRSAGNTVSSST